MKKITGFRFLLISLAVLSAPVLMMSCGSSKAAKSSMTSEDSKWYNGKEWLNGLQLTPHESINQQEFSRQYHMNSKYWDEAFNFLKTRNPAEMEPGTYIIDSNNVYAIIADLDAPDKDQVKWEAHRNFNDLQMILTGKAGMGVAKVASPNAVVTMPYDATKDIENFTVSGENYFDAGPETFFIFSPKEMHRPAFKIDGYNHIKKMVIKVRIPN